MNHLSCVYPVAGIVESYMSEWDMQFAEGKMPERDICEYAATTNNIELLNEAVAAGYLCDWLVHEAAADRGHLKILQRLHEIQIARGGHLNGCVTSMAMYHGHLGMMKWLHSMGYPLDKDAVNSAAIIGRLDVLQWVMSVSGETPSPYVLENCEHPDIIEWVKELRVNCA